MKAIAQRAKMNYDNVQKKKNLNKSKGANYLQGNQNSEEGSVALPKDWAGHGEQHGEHKKKTKDLGIHRAT